MTDSSARSRRPQAGGPDGVVLLDKPVGLSSNAALQKVRRLFGSARAGHTGSLDPLASGLLPICLGQATRFSGYVLDADKSYEVSARLGVRTATGDAEGEAIGQCAWQQLARQDLELVLQRFRGEIRQVPPMYSALKQGGERLYRKARRGEEVERAPRTVRISKLELVAFEPPEFSLAVSCSKGTYVRTLVEDVASTAGSCGHVTALRRVAAGPYGEGQMHTLAALEALAEAGPEALSGVVLPVDSALEALAAISLDDGQAGKLATGQGVTLGTPGPAALVRLYGPAGFMGLGQRDAAGQLRAKRLMATGAYC